MNVDEMFKDPAFKNLDPNSGELFKQMYSEMQNKKPPEQVAIFLKYQKRLFSGKPIPKEDLNRMMNVLIANLSPQEKAVFEKISKLM